MVHLNPQNASNHLRIQKPEDCMTSLRPQLHASSRYLACQKISCKLIRMDGQWTKNTETVKQFLPPLRSSMTLRSVVSRWSRNSIVHWHVTRSRNSTFYMLSSSTEMPSLHQQSQVSSSACNRQSDLFDRADIELIVTWPKCFRDLNFLLLSAVQITVTFLHDCSQ